MLEVFRHALALAAAVQGQLALLLRLQWIGGKRVAEMTTAAPFGAGLAPVEWAGKGDSLLAWRGIAAVVLTSESAIFLTHQMQPP